MFKIKIIKHLAALLAVLITGVLAGAAGSFLYNRFSITENMFETSSSGNTEIISEGTVYTVLPFQKDNSADNGRIFKLLQAGKIDCRFEDGAVMIKQGQVPLAMDYLTAAGEVPLTEHFSFREITADPKGDPKRYALQHQLATQNMVANMISVMSPDIDKAQVLLRGAPDSSKKNRTAHINLTIPKGRKLEKGLLNEITHNVITSFKNINKVVIADQNGKIYNYSSK